MTIKSSSKGFTLLEVMVACLLMGMLVTALTMVFNQSSIAWRTGVAGVVNLYETRADLGKKHDNYDNILPWIEGDSDLSWRAVSLWENGQLRSNRAIDKADESPSPFQAAAASALSVKSTSGGESASLFTVGVRSYGPDGRLGTADDLTTYPEDL